MFAFGRFDHHNVPCAVRFVDPLHFAELDTLIVVFVNDITSAEIHVKYQTCRQSRMDITYLTKLDF